MTLDATRRACLERWAERGLEDPSLEAALEALLVSPALAPHAHVLADELLPELADPAEVMRALAALAARPAAADLLGTERDVRHLARLADQGTHSAHALARHPEVAPAVLAARERGEPELGAMLEALEARIAAEGEHERADVMRALRRFKRSESLAIFGREVIGEHSVRETTRAVSFLAIVCLQVALEHAAAWAEDPSLADQICVLGMGKLGGLELNFSSDVDLILVCEDAAFEDEARREQLAGLARDVIATMEEVTPDGYVFRVDMRLRPEGARGLLVNGQRAMVEYYLNWGRTWERSAMSKARPIAGHLELGEALMRALDPFLYRKYLDFQALDDLRRMKDLVNRNAQATAVLGLEPEGRDDPQPAAPGTTDQRGAAGSGRGSLRKSSSRGRRGASAGGVRARARRARALAHMNRARPGSHTSRATRATPIDRSLPAELDPGADGAPDESYHSPGGPLGWDIKIGVGGIREIEFFVQALQLVHCGTRPSLRVRGTLEALDRLLYAGLVSHEDHAALGDAYDLFRRLEHRVQMEQDRQLHRMPATPHGLDALARRMGIEVSALMASVREAREAVSEIFGRLFRDSEQRAEAPTLGQAAGGDLDVVWAALSQSRLDARPVRGALEAAGFGRARQIAGLLEGLADRPAGPFSRQRATSKQAELGRYLLRACAAAPDPDQAFVGVSRLVSVVGARDWFWTMLGENPHASRLLVHVFGSSEYLTGLLLREPDVIAHLLGLGTAEPERSRAQMRRALRARLDEIVDPSHRIGRIHRFQQEETLRLAIHVLGGAIEIEQANEGLAHLAELVIEEVLQEIWLHLRRRTPSAPGSIADLPFCVLAMGKLGGLELGFGSDVDLLFVYEEVERVGLVHDVWAKLAQRLVRQLSAPGADGRLYEVDTRLRPSGRQGTLVVSTRALRDYHASGRAQLWERQALLRARPLTGTSALRRAIGLVRRAVALEAARPPGWRHEMVAMRARMGRGEGAGFDVKLSPGGLVDLEFLTQALQLELGHELEPHAPPAEVLRGEAVDPGVTSQSTGVALDALAAHPVVRARYPELDLDAISQDYRMLRRLEASIRINRHRGDSALPADADAAADIARRMGYQSQAAGAQLLHALEHVQERMESAWALVFGGDE